MVRRKESSCTDYASTYVGNLIISKIECVNNSLKRVSISAFLLVIMGCSMDETQTVTTMNNLVMEDEFDADNFLFPAL